jgi:hypothetical protein
MFWAGMKRKGHRKGCPLLIKKPEIEADLLFAVFN